MQTLWTILVSMNGSFNPYWFKKTVNEITYESDTLKLVSARDREPDDGHVISLDSLLRLREYVKEQ
jgi:hypothetical protein